MEEKQKLERENQHFAKESGQLKKESELLRKQIQTLSSKLIPLVKYRKQVKAIHPRMKQSSIKLIKQVQILKEDKNVLEKYLQDSQNEALVLQNEMESLKKTEEWNANSYQLQIDKLNKQIQHLKEKLQKSAPQKKQLKEELKQSYKQEKQLQKEQEKSQNQIALLKTQLQQLNKEQILLKEELKDRQACINQKDQNLKDIENLYNNLREVITQQEEGFTQNLQSYQRKYQESLKSFTKEEKNLKMNLDNSQKQIQELQEANNQKETLIESLKSQHSKQLYSLQQDMEGGLAYRKELENEIRNLKTEQESAFYEKEKTWEIKAGQEILKYKNSYETLKTEVQRELAALKTEQKQQIQKLCQAHEKRIRHICTEMENDLLNETKRLETLKTIKNRQIKEMESNLKSLQDELYKTKTENISFQKENKVSEESLNKEILKNAELENKNKNLKSLWENLQQELEKRNQQIVSLQKLNRDLSLLFNEKKAATSAAPLAENTLTEETENSPPPSP